MSAGGAVVDVVVRWVPCGGMDRPSVELSEPPVDKCPPFDG